MKGKAATLILMLVVLITPFITGYLSIPSEMDDSYETFVDIQKFWINFPKMIILHEYPLKNEQSKLTSVPQLEKPQQPPKHIIFNVYLSEGVGQWRRDSNSDLPVYDVIVDYEIYNDGTETAYDTEITIYLDDKIHQSIKTDIGADSHHSDHISIRLSYDSMKTVSIKASCEGYYDSDDLKISCDLPRLQASAGEMVKLYITPNDTIVKQRTQQIIIYKPFLEADWEPLRDWVKENIEYKHDSEKYGGEYWQLPRETLTLGEGDREDQAILLASMLRASGYESDEVYVICDKVPNHKTGELEVHAWVFFKISDILGFEKWKVLEPTAEGFIENSFDLEYNWENVCGRGEEHFRFNDVIYEKR